MRLPRIPLLALAAAALMTLGLTACSGDTGGDEIARSAPSAADFPSTKGKTIQDLLDSMPPSELVASPAASVFEVGKNRYPFGIFDVGGKQIEDADVALYFAKSNTSKVIGPVHAKVDSLETKPAYRAKGSEGPGSATTFYLAENVKFDRSGPWLVVAVIKGEDGFESSRLPSPTVGQFPKVAAVGDKAPMISTPTAESVGGDLSKIDTRQPPSSLHETDFKDVVGRQPVALQFATPALCQTRVCGPVVDITEQVKNEIGDGVEFIQMEIYKNNDPNEGLRPQLQPYGLQTEPWMFLIGKDGRIEKRIEGPFSVEELKADVERLKAQAG